MAVTQLHELSTLEAAAAVRAGEVSPTELVEHALARAATVGEQVGAFAVLTPELALARARELERPGPERPLLAGVPTAEKDLFNTAGVPTSYGSLALAGTMPPVDDNSVGLIRAAGLISIGKTTTPELGLPCYTEPDPAVGATARSPWDLSRSAGGSSGGAAAAVAAGVLPVATASDGGGSIRIPASACGLVGFKPSRGLVSNGPTAVDWSGLGVRGVETRTVRDTAALLGVLAVPFAGDTFTSPAQGTDFLGGCSRDPGQLRIGVITANVMDAPLDPAVRAAVDHAAVLLDSLGHVVTPDVPMLALGGLFEHFLALWCVGAAGAVIEPAREPLLRPLTRALRLRGNEFSGVELASAMTTLGLATRAALSATAAYDVLLMPTLAQLPAPVGSLRDDDDPWADFLAQGRFTPYTSQINVTGQPAVSLPLHWHDDEGVTLPVGVMLVGRPHDDLRLLQLAAQVEAAEPWSQRRPPVW